MVSFAYSHPVVLVALLAIAVALGTEPAGEVESRFVDLLMARPVSRGSVVDRSAAALLGATAAAVGTLMLGTWIGLLLLAPPALRGPERRVILSLAANLALVVLAWGAVALALGSLARRRAAAAAVTGLLALAMFLLDVLGRLWEPARELSWISPFHYFSPFPVIGGAPLPGKDLVVLAAIAVTGYAAARIGYARRDL
jgi:ABC-2 type transport system permease protein